MTGNGNNLVSQLLGLNQEQGANGSFGGGAGQIAGTNNNKSGFNTAARKLKLSDAFHGINVTPNFLFLCLFMGFVGWIWVVYFIRHHEPLANSVLGTGAAHSATADADRRLMASVKRTIPCRTSPQGDGFYVPIPQSDGSIASSGDYGYNAGSAAYAFPANSNMPLPSPPLPEPPSPTPPAPTPLTYSPYAAPQQPYAQPQRDAYFMPVPQASGNRVRMIVNR